MTKTRLADLGSTIHRLMEKKTKRKFIESVEIQIKLKNYNPARDRRCVIRTLLPYDRRYKPRACIIADAARMEEAQALLKEADVVDIEMLKAFNKDKRKIRKFLHRYHFLLCCESLIKLLPRTVGTIILKIGKFPAIIKNDVPIAEALKTEYRRCKIKIMKEINVGDVVGNVSMPEEQIEANVRVLVADLVKTLSKGWYNVKSMHLKTTMGEPEKIL